MIPTHFPFANSDSAYYSFNHGAKGIMSWDIPASSTLENAHGQMAKVATVSPVSDFLLGAQPIAVTVAAYPLLDVAYWSVDGRVLVGLANLDYVDHNGTFKIQLPIGATNIVSQPWGSVSWTLGGNGTLLANGLSALATSFVVLSST
jgi:hypothetical protein